MMIVFCTFPDLEKTRAVGAAIIETGLAACVNLVTGVESIYRWEGKVHQEPEVLGIFKVKSEGFGELEAALHLKHPYDVPEIVGIHTDSVAENYLKWVRSTGDSTS